MDLEPKYEKDNIAALSMFVLDVLRYDIEPIESIIRLLNDDQCIGWRRVWKSAMTIQDVLPEIKNLVKERLVDVYERNHDNSELIPVQWNEIDIDAKADEYWFLLTEAGRKVWEQWDPPIIEE